jgi:uncharacterized membrane protein YgcG
MDPTLAGDVLLLATGARARWTTKGRVETVLAGALLCTEVLHGARLSWLPPGRPRRKELRRLVERRALTARDEVAGPLVAAGVLAPLEHRLLGVVVRRGFAVLDRRSWADAEGRLRTALLTPHRDPGLASLAVLCAVSGIAGSLLPPPTDRRSKRALAAYLNGLRTVVGPELAEVLTATRDAYRRQHRDADSFVADSGRDPYGDSGGDGGGGDGGDGGGGGD